MDIGLCFPFCSHHGGHKIVLCYVLPTFLEIKLIIIYEGKKYPCRVCDYQATTKGCLAQHQRSVHEGKKYPCRECDHQTTSKSDLNKHQRAIHEGKKYPCRQCDYQAPGSLNKEISTVVCFIIILLLLADYTSGKKHSITNLWLYSWAKTICWAQLPSSTGYRNPL